MGDEVESLSQIDPLFGTVKQKYVRLPIYPKTHYVMKPETRSRAVETIKEELKWWEAELEKQGRVVEAQRIHQRVMYDLEMIKSMGYCHGIENYSRHFTGRMPGEPPPTLLDYFSRDFLLFIDESHQTVPQLHAMYPGDRSRKNTLVEYGFRMPSALDNRPLTFQEFEHRTNQIVYVSATPGPYELTKSGGVVVEQIIRPTGLVDPPVEIRPVKGQIDDLLHEIRGRVARGERVLVTTLTKRMAEDLGRVLQRSRGEVPLHAFGNRNAGAGEDSARSPQGRIRRADRDKSTARRARSAGSFAGGDSGCGQRRVSAVERIVDSDDWPLRAKFERTRSALRRPHDGLDGAGDGETDRRRAIQEAYNVENGITPESIVRPLDMSLARVIEADYGDYASSEAEGIPDFKGQEELDAYIAKLEVEMRETAKRFEFEKAAKLRDRIKELRTKEFLFA